MKEHIELFMEAAKRIGFGVTVMTPADYLLKVVELKMKRGEQRLTEEDMRAMKKIIDGHMGNTLSISAEAFMGEEILRDWLNTEKGDQHARRYCLVNGLIPYNVENIKDLPDFYIDAEHLPPEMQKKLLEIAETKLGTFDEEVETEEIKILNTSLEGAWIYKGKVGGFKVSKTRRIKVTSFYNYSE